MRIVVRNFDITENISFPKINQERDHEVTDHNISDKVFYSLTEKCNHEICSDISMNYCFESM